MIYKKNKAIFIMSVLFLSFDHAIAEDYKNIDAIQIIKDGEIQLGNINKDIDALWKECFEQVPVQKGYVTTKINETTSVSIPITASFDQEVRRKASCTETLVESYNQSKLDFKNKTKDIVSLIGKIDPKDLNKPNEEGYTAQNYCYTYELYEALRNQGAFFQVVPWAYFNPVTATSIVAATAIAMYVLYQKFLVCDE